MERESSEEERRVVSKYSSHKRWNCDWLEWVVTGGDSAVVDSEVYWQKENRD